MPNAPLAQVMSGKGYETGAIHPHPWTSAYFGFNKGFKYFDNFIQKGRVENLVKGSKISSIIMSLRAVIDKEGSNLPWENYYDRIREWVNFCKRPYFLWVFLLDTHTPYLPPERKWSQLNYWRLAYLFWKIERRKWNCKDEKEVEKIKDAYDDEIYYSDKFIKRLWEDLKDDNPIFIIHADHGDGLGEHGFYRHPPLLYEELIHVPLVIYNADSGVTGKIKKPISLECLAPAILELIRKENEFYSQVFLNDGNDWAISKVYEKEQRKIAVRMKDWKFITGQSDKDKLYYLKKDPQEQENVIRRYPELAREMTRIVKSHLSHEVEKNEIRKFITSLKNGNMV